MFDKTAPKGMRDILPNELIIRENVMHTIKNVYRSFGFNGIETPCVEDLSILTSKQGGDNEKLIFKILKRGEKLENSSNDDLCDLGLRYDLTVPLTRYYANNQGKLPSVFKAMQIGNVWRAERPQKGRFRQFVQCDIDIIGEDTFLAETELILATTQALISLGLADFTLRINDRRLLTSLANECGFKEEEHESVFIALDKLDKIDLTGVREELYLLDPDKSKADKFLKIIEQFNNTEKPLQYAQQFDGLAAKNLQSIIEITQSLTKSKIVFDISLVRGMNYYTGTIFEISYDDYGVSVAGGGRYDKMLGKFLGTDIPACGFSIGFERICAILTEQNKTQTQTEQKIALIVDKDANLQNLQKVFTLSKQYISEGKICTVIKRIKNFGYLIKQLKEQGYTELFILEGNDIRKVI